ncbi:MAG: metallophosphoesterase [Cytophagaceae bacterium]
MTEKVRIAAVGDIHVREGDKGKWTDFFKKVSSEADLLLLCGDLTDTGHKSEADVLAKELKACSIPVVAVLGNHDYEAGEHDLIKKTISSDKTTVLDGDSVIIGNIGIAGVKGFGGGFDTHMLPMWGEKMNKDFVQEAVNQALSLERALIRIDKENLKKIVILHYSPIKETVIGEPEPIFPFMGSSRLAEPINRRDIDAVFHGHAHKGTIEGKTSKGIKVYNVSLPLLLHKGHEGGYFIIEV